MIYDFDRVIDRSNTDCLKYDFRKQRHAPENAIPMWVADMDFPTAEPVVEAIIRQAKAGVYGYTDTRDDYVEILKGWYEKNFGWCPRGEWLIKTPGVVFALAMGVRAFTKPGESVLIQEPVYYPFREVVEDNGRALVGSPLVYEAGRYRMDFANLEKKVREFKVKLILLCSPHNPVGRVWTREELIRVEEIALRYGAVVISDEIHSDFVWDEHRHHVLASLKPEFEENTVICTSPSKTFNLAGLQCSNIFIPNQKLHMRFKEEIAASGYSQPNAVGVAACKAAYSEGEDWLNQVRAYIRENIRFMEEFTDENLPGIRMIRPEGTYLVWMDFRSLGMTEKERRDFMLNKAGLWLDSGSMFGSCGAGFERFNAACPRPVLSRAMHQLKTALETISY